MIVFAYAGAALSILLLVNLSGVPPELDPRGSTAQIAAAPADVSR